MPRKDFASGAIHRPYSTYPIGINPRNNLNQISNAWASWSTGAASVTPNATANPFGTSDAAKLVESATTANHVVQNNPNTGGFCLQGQWFCFQVWAKAAERSKIGLSPRSAAFGSTNCQAWYNLATGAIGGVQAGAIARIQAGPSSWYLCQLAAQCTTSTTAYLIISIENAGGFLESYLGDGSSGIYAYQAWMFQVNPSFPFSP